MKALTNTLFLLLLVAFSCKDEKPLSQQETSHEQILSSEAQGLTNDPFTLKSAQISNSMLRIEVQYSGGCEEHAFTLVWPEVITMIYPHDFGLELYHNGNEDLCEALPTEILEFNLAQNSMNLSISDLQAATIRIVNASIREEVVNVE